MEPKQDIELAIRSAQTIKAIAQLIGCSDAGLAKLVFHQCLNEFDALGNFVMSMDERPKPPQRRGGKDNG